MQAITPDEAIQSEHERIPEFMIAAFNELIKKNIRGKHVKIYQKEAIEEVKKHLPEGVTIDQAFSNGWFDVEIVYRRAGWKVSYDKPAYNENYDPSWDLEAKKKSLEG